VLSNARISVCIYIKKYNTETGYLRLTLDSTKRESEWKPPTLLAKKKEKSYEPRLVNTISLLDFDLYQFFELAGRAVVTVT